MAGGELLARTATVRVIATSLEGLRINCEQLFRVVPLDISAGTELAAVGLFGDRARAVNPDGAIHDEVDAAAGWRSAASSTASRWRSSGRRPGRNR